MTVQEQQQQYGPEFKVVYVVTFLSPGTFVDESTRVKYADGPSYAEICAEAGKIKERHNARPYGFTIASFLTREPVPDGHGGVLNVEPRQLSKSGIHYLGGTLRTQAEVLRDNLPQEEIWRDNMVFNAIAVIVENTNSYKVTREFHSADLLLDPVTCKVIRRGDDADLEALRNELREKRQNTRRQQ